MGKIQKLALSFGAFLWVSLLNPAFVWAVEEINICPPGQFNPLCGIQLQNVISAIIRILLAVAALIAFIFLIIGGIKWITAGSNKEAAAEARGTLTAALIGLVIVFLAFLLLNIVKALFGIDLLKLELPSFTGQ